MATHTVAWAKHFTLTGSSTVDEVVLTDEPTEVEVLIRGTTGFLSFTVAAGENPPDPTELGDDTYVVMAGGPPLVVPLPTAVGPTRVKLVSATALDVSVTGIG
jgi:hypothetical protein